VSDFAVRILERFIRASGFEGGIHWSSLKTENGGRFPAAAGAHAAANGVNLKDQAMSNRSPRYSASSSPDSADAIAARLIASGHGAATVDSAVALIRGGHADLLQQVLDRKRPQTAWQIARRRGRP
jgi:hypothetical protein